MDRIPFARLASQREEILRRLPAAETHDSELHARAAAELRDRLKVWWGGALPPLTQFADHPPKGAAPFRLTADPAELIALRAISSTREIAYFGVESGGAIFTEEKSPAVDDSFRVYVTGLSPLLDQVGDILNYGRVGSDAYFYERDGHFFTADDREFVKVQPPRSPFTSFLDWCQRLVDAVLEWWEDDGPVGSAASNAHQSRERSDRSRDRIYQLVVDFDTGAWPTSGVLREMGYHVGKNGLGAADRRSILSDVYTVELVAASPESESYIREWGSPKSARRLAKMKRCLATFAAGARRKSTDMSAAILDWESDYEWLGSTFG